MPTQPVKPRHEGLGAMFYVTLLIFGLLIIIGVIFWMFQKGGGIRHSPDHSELRVPPTIVRQVSVVHTTGC